MTILEGYLVVLKPGLADAVLNNSKYRGLYRTPPYSMESYQKGFDNPYVFEKSISEDGLIPTLDLAQSVRIKFTEIHKFDDLEIIYVQTWNSSVQPEVTIPNVRFLGFDIAGTAPFWSIVGDCPSSSDPRFHNELGQLNEYGLFDTVDLAEKYFKNHLTHFTEGRDQGLVIWRVYLVEN